MPCEFHVKRPSPLSDVGSGCQFEHLDPEYFEAHGETLCEFHTPLEGLASRNTKKNKWGKGRIDKFYKQIHSLIDLARERSEVCDLTGVVFPDDADFSKKKFPAVCFFRTQFSDGIANFSEAQFLDGPVDFSEARFGSDVRFINSKFEGLNTFFRFTEFNGSSEFSGAKFLKGSVWFDHAEFHKSAWFDGVVFARNVYFHQALFKESANFSANSTLGGVDPQNKNPFQGCFFGGTSFEGLANFTNRQFLNTTSFRNCVFFKSPSFHN